jgi:hypothetical protein
MGMKTLTSKLSQPQQYQALRQQIPVMELTEITTEELIEPFPSGALQWYKTSRVALFIGVALALVVVALNLFAVKDWLHAERGLNSGQFRNPSAITNAIRKTKEIQARGIPGSIHSNSIITCVRLALQDCARWSFKQENQRITFDYVLSAVKDPAETLKDLDKGLGEIGYHRVGTAQDEGNYRHIVAYGTQ